MTTTAPKTEQPKKQVKRVQDSNVYRLSFRNRTGQSVFLSKVILKKHGTIQIESVGAATSESAKVVQILVKHGYANIKNIRTEQFHPDSTERRERGFQIKMIVLLEKSANFDKLTENLDRKE